MMLRPRTRLYYSCTSSIRNVLTMDVAIVTRTSTPADVYVTTRVARIIRYEAKNIARMRAVLHD